jgi:hypothetical protein
MPQCSCHWAQAATAVPVGPQLRLGPGPSGWAPPLGPSLRARPGLGEGLSLGRRQGCWFTGNFVESPQPEPTTSTLAIREKPLKLQVEALKERRCWLRLPVPVVSGLQSSRVIRLGIVASSSWPGTLESSQKPSPLSSWKVELLKSQLSTFPLAASATKAWHHMGDSSHAREGAWYQQKQQGGLRGLPWVGATVTYTTTYNTQNGMTHTPTQYVVWR